MDDGLRIVNVTAVAVAGRGLVIKGASGSGKSGLALEMMARGADLVSDDGVVITRRDGALWLHAPEPLRGMIEARGIGLLGANPVDSAQLVAVLDLDKVETDRLPPFRQTDILGQSIALLHNFVCPSFPAALVQYLRHGRRE